MLDAEEVRALELTRGVDPTPTNLERVAGQTSGELSRWAFAQWDSRARAKAKFSKADEMLFVREALEQATDERLARYHASRFPAGELVADLTTGIGGDLIALAGRGPAVGYELDPERVRYARHNLLVHRLDAEIRSEDSLAAAWTFDYAFADPARRVGGRRTVDPEAFSPSPRALAERMAGLKLGAMKLTPMLRDDDLQSLGPAVEFVSLGGECREALVWMGAEAAEGRWAVHVESGERLAAQPSGRPTTEVGNWFFEADPAAIRAHALGTLEHEFSVVPLAETNGYLTGEEPVSSPWLKSYRVLYSGKGDVRTTRAELRRLGAALPVVKQRGAGVDPTRMAKEFGVHGTRQVVVAIWTVGKSLRHTVMEPQA